MAEETIGHPGWCFILGVVLGFVAGVLMTLMAIGAT